MSDADKPRSIAKRMPDGWKPPVPAWSAFASHDGQITIAYYGVQMPIEDSKQRLASFRTWISALLVEPDAPASVEYAEFVDAQGYYTWLVIGYWIKGGQYARWSSSDAHERYWQAAERMHGNVGFFREVLSVPFERFETLQSQPLERAGAARACPVLQGPIREHNYWGSMRDRIVASGHDGLDASAVALSTDATPPSPRGQRVRVEVPANLAVIRSGQAFGDLEGQEKTLYFASVEPALRDGMLFLRDHPSETGCLSSRLLQETDAEGHPLPRTFGLLHFVSLRHLEDWAHRHPTHLRIFNTFIDMAKALGGELKLRLWHEVAVLPDGQQIFEYVNCHSATGLLARCDPPLLLASGVSA